MTVEGVAVSVAVHAFTVTSFVQLTDVDRPETVSVTVVVAYFRPLVVYAFDTEDEVPESPSVPVQL